MSNIQKLLESFSKNGNNYRLYKRGKHAMIYAIVGSNGKDLDYEVFRIRVRPAGKRFGRDYPPTEEFPSSESFGRTAWWCNTLEKAVSYFYKLERGGKCGYQASGDSSHEEDLPKVDTEYQSDLNN